MANAKAKMTFTFEIGSGEQPGAYRTTLNGINELQNAVLSGEESQIFVWLRKAMQEGYAVQDA